MIYEAKNNNEHVLFLPIFVVVLIILTAKKFKKIRFKLILK